MKSFKNLKRLFSKKANLFPGNSASYSTYSHYYHNKTSHGYKYFLGLGFAGYLYFQEDLLSTVMTQVQLKYYKYRSLMKHNKEIYERNQYSELLFNSFDPESRIEFFHEKISKHLDVQKPFEGDFLSSFVDDRIQEIKDNGAQIYFAQKGGGKTLDSLRIARDWKKKGEPVLFFDKSDYNDTDVEILEKCGFKQISLLRDVLQEMNTDPRYKPFNIIEHLNKLLMFGHPPRSQTNNDKQKKQLLIVVDDADELFTKSKEDSSKKKFLIQLKELMKQDLVKLLFLCREWETKNWVQEEFDAGVWKGISKGSSSLRSKPIVIDYLSYISDTTGLKPSEVEKFFFFFGVDYSTLRDLKKYMRWYAEKNKTSAKNIDDFIDLKVKEYAEIFKEKEIDKPLIRICRQIENKPADYKIKDVLTTEDKIKLAPVFGPEGWVSFKYEAAAYFLCGKSWKNIKPTIDMKI